MSDSLTKYKDSGVAWIGEIPRHWNLSMLKYAARLVYGDTLISENREDGVVPVYGSNGIIDTHSSANTLSPAIIVGRKGSLGKVQYSDVPCFVIDTAYFIDRRTSHVNLRWLHYVLQVLELERFRNSVLPGLNREAAEGQYVPLITAEEQTRIAKFLDRKTEQIDELIRIKERRIELLQGQRTALINQAVTKGLDPNVEMKPSGVEWIGEIPAHWEVKRLKYIADLNMGQSPPSEEYNSDQIGTPFLQGNAEFGLHHPIPKIYCPIARKYANPGDILLSVRAPVGAINVADQEYGIGRGLCAIRPRTNQLEYHYAKYLIEVVRTQLHIVATGSTYDAVTVDDVSNVTCVVPPLSEQVQIADFLNNKTQQIDELITAEQRKIELLKEYRQSLISEAVTGKIEVRNEG